MTGRHMLAISRRIAPEVCWKLLAPKSEGAGNAGCALHPRSRARSAQRKVHTSIQGNGEHPTFPAQWLYGLLRDLPGEPCTFATVDARLGASGPHDFAVRFSCIVMATSASTASHRAFVTCARPSCRAGRASHSADLGFGKSEIFLILGLDAISVNSN